MAKAKRRPAIKTPPEMEKSEKKLPGRRQPKPPEKAAGGRGKGGGSR